MPNGGRAPDDPRGPASITGAIERSDFPPRPPSPDELIEQAQLPEPDELGNLSPPPGADGVPSPDELADQLSDFLPGN